MKTNTLFQTNKLKDFKVNLAYEEWLREFISPPCDNELNCMENDLKISRANNSSYNPILGA